MIHLFANKSAISLWQHSHVFPFIPVSFSSDRNQCCTTQRITRTSQWPDQTVIPKLSLNSIRCDLKQKRRLQSRPLSLVTHWFIVRHGKSSPCQPLHTSFASSGTQWVKLGFLRSARSAKAVVFASRSQQEPLVFSGQRRSHTPRVTFVFQRAKVTCELHLT